MSGPDIVKIVDHILAFLARKWTLPPEPAFIPITIALHPIPFYSRIHFHSTVTKRLARCQYTSLRPFTQPLYPVSKWCQIIGLRRRHENSNLHICPTVSVSVAVTAFEWFWRCLDRTLVPGFILYMAKTSGRKYHVSIIAWSTIQLNSTRSFHGVCRPVAHIRSGWLPPLYFFPFIFYLYLQSHSLPLILSPPSLINRSRQCYHQKSLQF